MANKWEEGERRILTKKLHDNNEAKEEELDEKEDQVIRESPGQAKFYKQETKDLEKLMKKEQKLEQLRSKNELAKNEVRKLKDTFK